MNFLLVLSVCLASFSLFNESVAITNPNTLSKNESAVTFKSVADEITMLLLETWTPEDKYAVGMASYLTETLRVSKGYTESKKKEFLEVEKRLQAYEEAVKNDKLLEKEFLFAKDLLQNNLKLMELNEKYGRLTLYTYAPGNLDLLHYLFGGLNNLVIRGVDSAQVGEKFNKYVRGNNGSLPFISGALEEIRSLFYKYKAQGKVIIPSKRELNYIIDEKRQQAIYDGITKILPADQKDLVKELASQFQEYISFIKSELLPLAPEETIMPEEVYICLLKAYGVNDKPEEMINRAKADFDIWMEKYKTLALSIAKEKGWDETNPAKIVARLKEEAKLKDDEQIVQMYKRAQGWVNDLIQSKKIATLPQKELQMRRATPAEEAVIPAPAVWRPPVLNADGTQWPLFVLSNLKSYGDPVSAYSLIAHEGNPGHFLQWSRIIEMLLQGKLNYLEIILTANSLNTEGWAHYMEYIISEYFDAPAKLGAIQDQLLRITRMFLDPMANTGKATYEDVIKFLTENLGLDQARAESEAKRYCFLKSGQATAYRLGALKIMDLREKVEKELGEKFNLQSFHDAILSFGTLPMYIIADHIVDRMNH